MISESLLEELKKVFKAEYQLDLTNRDAREIGEGLLKHYEALIKIFKEKSFDENKN